MDLNAYLSQQEKDSHKKHHDNEDNHNQPKSNDKTGNTNLSFLLGKWGDSKTMKGEECKYFKNNRIRFDTTSYDSEETFVTFDQNGTFTLENHNYYDNGQNDGNSGNGMSSYSGTWEAEEHKNNVIIEVHVDKKGYKTISEKEQWKVESHNQLHIKLKAGECHFTLLNKQK